MSLRHRRAILGAATTSPPLSVSVTPSTINEAETLCPIQSSLLTATPSGGTPPYTFLWDFSAGGTGISIDSPTASSTAVTKAGAGISTGTLRCTVTDDVTDTAADTSDITLECGT